MEYSIALTLILSFFALVAKQSKGVTVLFFIFIWMMFGWNYWNGDYEAYEVSYEIYGLAADISGMEYEVGYKMLMVIGNLLGLTYQQFFIVIAFLILALWFRFTMFFSKSPALFSLCFFLAFIPLDYVLLRNTLAFSIVIQGLISIFKDLKYKYVKFVLAVLLASTIHSSSLFYLSLLFAFRTNVLDMKKFALLLLVSFVVFVLFKDSFLSLISSNSEGRDTIYTSSIINFLLWAGIQFINLFIVFYFYTRNKKSAVTLDNNFDNGVIIVNINILLLFLIITYFSINITTRLFRNIAIVNVIYMLNSFVMRRSVRVELLDYVLVIIYLLFFYIYYIAPFLGYTIDALFRFNLIF